ncbi:adenylyltransferase/cytidyltransferase family protein [Cytophagaceae bacterium YF14B1]|uniref:Phosphopantetheine adenylyltransferase n=1 Tax=Xanthocytophaga flava TaxID=3048013 RepID=A0AAE3QQP0_9BACT|nr:adenylyltransferase/cytidyltransferase family protein [Xanthocytophaga flavus]MDJ1483717.1 adenylyltransferase/cytidyltransferase family protein [Xanthocytophaga flavus]
MSSYLFEYANYSNFFEKYQVSPAGVERLQYSWNEPHRFYHTEKHLSFLIDKIEKSSLSEEEKDKLRLTAFFHDVVYDPTAQDNEERSAEMLKEVTQHPVTEEVVEMILDTKTHKPRTELSRQFVDWDMAIVSDSDFTQLMEWERGVFKEFQFVDYSMYKMGRLALLDEWTRKYPNNSQNLQNLMSYLMHHRPRVGVYPGSFNPLHNGHLNILHKAEKIFDKVIIAQGINPEKDAQETDITQLNVFKYRQTEKFPGLLTDYLSKKESDCDITLVRGLRNGDDLDYEVNQLRFMEDMKPDIKVIFIRCDKQFEHISSSAIRNLEKIGKGLGHKYVPNGGLVK